MDASLLTTGFLALAWGVTLCIVIASLAFGAMRIGHSYVFTAPGVSRLGPPIGQRVPTLHFVHQGRRVSLRQVLAPDRPTLLVFLGALGEQEMVRNTALSGLQQFMQLASGSLHVVVFCTTATEHIEQALAAVGPVDVIALPDDRLMAKLALRVAPYALLISKRATVLEKGLVNHLEHLCLLIVRGGQRSQVDSIDDVGELERLCASHLDRYVA